MTIDQAILEHIIAYSGTTYPVCYGSAEDESTPYYVIFKVADDERPDSLCEDQGDSGKAVFIVQGWGGGQIGAGFNSANAVIFTEALKNHCNRIRGVIGSAPNRFRVWYNETGGVVPIERGAQSLLTWGAEFTMVLWWNKI